MRSRNVVLVLGWLVGSASLLSAQVRGPQDVVPQRGMLGAGVREEWLARYNGPGNGRDQATAMTVDADGDTYVTGLSVGVGSDSDYATVKYDAAGDQLWVARYNGPANSVDHARALAVDAGGNTYVTGASCAAADPEKGCLNWDYATVKYDAGGDQLWVARYNGPGNAYDGARALALDAAGNVYVTGLSWGGPATGFDYATIKYDGDGNELWVARYNNLENNYDDAVALAADAAGNTYVTGLSCGTGPFPECLDYATVKYDAEGNLLWVARYNGPAHGREWATAIALDADGNAYVTGYSQSLGGDHDYATIKYDTHGKQLWVARYDGPANGQDIARALAVDADGNVYVTGASCGTGPYPECLDYATVKFDSNGHPRWVARYDGPGNGQDEAFALAVDADGNVYVTGLSWGGPATGFDYATIKYDSAGNPLWVTRYNGPANGSDAASAIALDAYGHPYVTGASVGVGTGLDYATIKYAQ